jgi:hypothetical protein
MQDLYTEIICPVHGIKGFFDIQLQIFVCSECMQELMPILARQAKLKRKKDGMAQGNENQRRNN